jgi:ubiquinone/menaquinone biosynthesis C-methylase UbiE
VRPDSRANASAVGTAAPPERKGHRWFAALYDPLSRGVERRVLGRLRTFITGEASGRVLEIGAGTGANFPYYRTTQKVVATEPDPYMLRRARQRATELGVDVDLHQAAAESLPFPDHTFDTVVSTLVLCTVDDQARSLAEISRVLKPGGELRFIEHVRGSGLLGRIQDRVVPIWRWFGAGCHPNRRTAQSIRAAGFDMVELRGQQLVFLPLLVGTARTAEENRTAHDHE